MLHRGRLIEVFVVCCYLNLLSTSSQITLNFNVSSLYTLPIMPADWHGKVCESEEYDQSLSLFVIQAQVPSLEPSIASS